MESTGIYWKPVYNILEGYFDVIVANAQRIKNVPGRKTDVCDAEWIAKLLRVGLVEASFIPTEDLREMQDLCRLRKKRVGNLTAEKNRIQKYLESCNVKLGTVISDVFGVSGRNLLGRLVEQGHVDSVNIDECVKGNTHAKVALCEAAWATPRSRNTERSTKFWKIASRRGKKKACIAMARKILVISYHILKNKQLYLEGGPKAVDRAS